jgi:hypothetical protein
MCRSLVGLRLEVNTVLRYGVMGETKVPCEEQPADYYW